MTRDDPKTLVSTQWLAEYLKDPDLRVLDASWYLPGFERDSFAEYQAAHFFDLDDVSDHRSDLPHMVLPVGKFISRMCAIGVGDRHQIVVYDGSGLFSAPRVWWLFKLIGQMDIAVLDGGFPKWQAEGHPVEDLLPILRDRHMMARRQNHVVKDVTQVLAASKLRESEIVDARSPGRFHGKDSEPRPGLRAGHIPGLKNVFYKDFLRADDTMKSPDEMRQIFVEAGVDSDKPIITSCGSGVTAAILSLGLTRMGKTDRSLYDISWTEWGMFPTLPIATRET